MDPSEFLLRSYNGEFKTKDTFEQRAKCLPVLNTAVEEHLLADQGEGAFKFTHDQILQSFSTKDPSTTLGILLLSLYWRHPVKKSWALFSGLKLLKTSNKQLSEQCRAIMVKLNSQAAKMAYQKSAFYSLLTIHALQ